MVSLEKFYENVEERFHNEVIKEKFKPLLDDVIGRLPDEPQFLKIDEIYFAPKSRVLEYLISVYPEKNFTKEWVPEGGDGDCQTGFSEDGDISKCIISLLTDYLQDKKDDYIKGVIIHEICHMIYLWNLLQKEKLNFAKLSLKAKKIRLNQIGQTDIKAGSKEYYEKEKKVNAEAKKLGYEKEISCI